MIEGKRDEILWFRRRLLSWAIRNTDDFPWRTINSPIHQLIAEVLLQRTKAEQVVDVFNQIVKKYPTLKELSKLSEAELKKIIQPLGLHWRAKFLHRLIQRLWTYNRGVIPDDYEELVDLPAIGNYVASAYLSLHRNIRQSIIDSNVVRVYGRFFGFEYNNETRRKQWLVHVSEELTPKRKFKMYNYALLDFARKLCKKKPLCQSCPLNNRCKYFTACS